MRGSDVRGQLLTTDLLSEWTDPDSAMEAVGASLGIFAEGGPNPRSLLAADSPLRNALYQELLGLVQGGVLDKRLCSDGRYAFRWRDAFMNAAGAYEPTARLAPPATPQPSPAVERDLPTATKAARLWPRLFSQTAPLWLPASSCVLVILAFVWLDHAVAIGIATALAVVGAFGLLRRAPSFAALWSLGLVVAVLLLRFS